MSRKKIMFVIWALEVGGAERFLVKLVSRIPREEYDLTVACIHRKGVWAGELEKLGVRTVTLDKKVGADLPFFLRLVRLIRAEKPDIVNTHLWSANLWGTLAARLAGVKTVILTQQNVDLWKNFLHRSIDLFLSLLADRIICVSREVVSFYREGGIPEKKLVMIPNAIDTAPYAGERGSRNRSGTPFTFICNARLHKQKAHHVMLEAVRLLRAGPTPDFRLLLVGGGELREELETQSRQKGIADIVDFLGIRQDIPDLLKGADAFVLSSDYEGLPLALLEAMAAALPVIATTVGGNPELVQDGVNGYLVPPQRPDALAGAMLSVLGDPARSTRMGIEGRKLVQECYSIEKAAEQTLGLFESCLGGR